MFKKEITKASKCNLIWSLSISVRLLNCLIKISSMGKDWVNLQYIRKKKADNWVRCFIFYFNHLNFCMHINVKTVDWAGKAGNVCLFVCFISICVPRAWLKPGKSSSLSLQIIVPEASWDSYTLSPA